MGIHDFDLGRWFMGEVSTVQAVGGALAYPEMKSVGDIDNALINMVFENGTLGSVQLSRNSVFGYDIRTELWGTKGSIQIGYFQHTPILVMTQEGITHDVVPHFMQRFEGAYLTQIQDFVNGTLGSVQLSRNSVFGYDIRTELWGTKGSIQIGYFQHTPILVMTQEGITHDVVPHFMQRFEGAY